MSSVARQRQDPPLEPGNRLYALVDRRIETLCLAQKLLLWASRSWCMLAARSCCPPRQLAPVFAQMGALCALPDFHMVMTMLHRDGLEPLALNPVASDHVGEQEAVLLCLWHDAADPLRCRSTLALMVDHDMVPAGALALERAAEKLAAAGLSTALEGIA